MSLKLPYDLSTSIYSNFSDNPGITLRWKCDDSRKTTDTVLGFDLSYRKVGASEWVEVPWKAGYHRGNGSYTLLPNYLEPDATYEWRVRTVLNDNIEGWKGGPHTEWVDGPRFTTPKVAATPMRAAAVIGNGRTLEFTAMPNTVRNERQPREEVRVGAQGGHELGICAGRDKRNAEHRSKRRDCGRNEVAYVR